MQNITNSAIPANKKPSATPNFDPRAAVLPDQNTQNDTIIPYDNKYQLAVTQKSSSMKTENVVEFTKVKQGETLREIAERVMQDPRFQEDFKDMSVEGVMTLLMFYNEDITLNANPASDNLVFEADQEIAVI